MRKINKIAAAAATTAVLFGGSVLAASPALAGTGDCSSGYACAWEHSYYNGSRVTFQYGIPRLSQYGFDNKASSLRNNGRTSNVRWYQGVVYTERSWLQPRNTVVKDLRGTFLQDSISSARFV